MYKIARLGLCLVLLLFMPTLWFLTTTIVAGNTPIIGDGGVTVVMLPFVIVAAASMYAAHHTLYAERFSGIKGFAFHFLNLAVALLLTVASGGIAGLVQIGVFGE